MMNNFCVAQQTLQEPKGKKEGNCSISVSNPLNLPQKENNW